MENLDSVRPFPLSQGAVPSLDMTPIYHDVPDEGFTDQVLWTSAGRKAVVGPLYGKGGEGVVYGVKNYPGKIVKIYRNKVNCSFRKTKIELMVSHPLNNPTIGWPQEALYDTRNKFLGYLRDDITGIDLSSSIAQNTYLAVPKTYPGFSRTYQVRLILSVLESLKYLHDRNILVGDLKLENLLLKKDDFAKAYIVDCDSFQVDKYPCPVLTSEYTSPSFYNKEASCYYRTMEDEYFAVASLLFHLFFFGKNPYSYCTNAKDPNDKEANDYLLKNQYPPFAYNLKRSNKRIPKGIYGILWSHLPGFLKEDFVNEFTGTKVIATGQWLDDMKSYLHYLLDGRIAKVDPEANSILPESSLPYKLLALPRPKDERSSAVTGLVMKAVICEALLQLPSLSRILSPFFWDPIVIALEHSPIYEGQYRNGKLTVRLEKNNGILKTVRAELTY
ncbi:MAG: hypothetical protein LKM30_04315 [Bacilli bacterium]|jgi:serine/threonine protein kinase|nr:hypothetical protein [Bacilli bacterium]